MKKISLFMISLSLFGLVACGGGEEDATHEDETTQVDEDASIEMTDEAEEELEIEEDVFAVDLEDE